MRAQLNQMIELAELPTVSLQVFPHSQKPHSGMDGAFTVLGFEEEEDPDLLYVDHVTGSLQAEDPAHVRHAALVFDRLRTDALSPSDSVALMERVGGGCNWA